MGKLIISRKVLCIAFYLAVLMVLIPLSAKAQLEDTKPPNLLALTFIPSTIDVSTSQQDVYLSAQVTDDLSGFQRGIFYLTSPSGGQGLIGYINQLVSGDGNNGIYRGGVTFPQFSEAGVWHITYLRLDDMANNSVFLIVPNTVNVTSVNRPPIFTPIGDKTVLEGQLLQFTITATDPDGNNLTYSASNLPEGASFDPTTQTFTWTPTFDQAGNYPNIEFTVVDDGSPMEVAVQLITITVGNVNRAPVFTPVGIQQTLEDQPLQFYVNATDYDGDSVSFSTGPLPTGAEFNSNTRFFSWAPDQTQAGTYIIDFFATDNYINPATGTTSVVINVGDVPTPTEITYTIINMVIGLNLDKEVENSYMANLKKVCPFIGGGKITPAINQLNAFINKVQTNIEHGKIGSIEGNNLINLADTLITKLQG